MSRIVPRPKDGPSTAAITGLSIEAMVLSRRMTLSPMPPAVRKPCSSLASWPAVKMPGVPMSRMARTRELLSPKASESASSSHISAVSRFSASIRSMRMVWTPSAISLITCSVMLLTPGLPASIGRHGAG